MPRAQRPFFVVNPHSANGSTGHEWSAIAERLKSELGPIEFAFTEMPGQATDLARRALIGGHDLIVSVGGDGTNNEVVNGFFKDDRAINLGACFGYICRGTGGDFRKSFGFGKELEEAIAHLKSEEERRLDVGRLRFIEHTGREDCRYFLNITSFGVSGLVDHYVNTGSKALGGKISFLKSTLRALFNYRNQSLRLKIDEHFDEEVKVYIVAVANGRFFGGGMMMAPTAEPDDGLFDIVVMGDYGKLDVLTKGSHIYKGTHLADPLVRHLQGRHIEATPLTDTPILIDMDGEAPGRLPATFDMLPKALGLKI